MKSIRILSAVALVALNACSNEPLEPPGYACTLIAISPVSVTVQDSITGAAIGAGSTLTLRDGAFVDSLVVPLGDNVANSLPLSTPNSYERAGTYTVTVRRAGYATWVRAGVVVTRDECHVRPVALTARLQPTS